MCRRDLCEENGEAQGLDEDGYDMSITPEQVRQARKLLGWSQIDLAWEAEIALNTVDIFEETIGHLSAGEIDKLQAALEAAL